MTYRFYRHHISNISIVRTNVSSELWDLFSFILGHITKNTWRCWEEALTWKWSQIRTNTRSSSEKHPWNTVWMERLRQVRLRREEQDRIMSHKGNKEGPCRSKLEAVDVAGILDKSLEAVLVIGIVYLMWLEKKRISKAVSWSKVRKGFFCSYLGQRVDRIILLFLSSASISHASSQAVKYWSSTGQVLGDIRKWAYAPPFPQGTR